jgi:hypothetical protein
MTTYASATATARRLIQSKGKATTITPAAGDGDYDPIDQVVTSDPAAPFACAAVGLPAGKSAEFAVGSMVGRNIQQFYIATADGVRSPIPGDRIAWGGADWTLKWTATYDPAADGAIFTSAYGER